ncbi:MAG: MraY family glycosyltransferase [Bacteroidales bacterium]|jgi:UDP-GlcNAc:undecaprenyl-phosphate GlcNAc-1-phosphate transferase|nr:MraY family glycosyltransferase [Bacteroidales bacterium]HPE99466.1 MraY family glycosyltransferase [Bacteroidales bacterium]
MVWNDIVLVVVLFFGFSLIINGLFLKFSSTLGLRTAKEAGVRWSASQKPSFGGITFYILFLISVISYSMLFPNAAMVRNVEFLGLMLAVSIGFIAGLFDDAFNTKPLIKFGLQILTAVVIIFSGSAICITGNMYGDMILTAVWVIGIMNAINLLDNMDAIASVVVIFILACFLVIMQLNGLNDGPYLFISIGLIAAVGGFLFFNWNPSKLFMGDTGSMFLGTAVAFLGIKYGWNIQLENAVVADWQKVLTVVVVFIVPLTDTTTVFIKRIFSGHSPFIGGKDHTTHHLSYLGLSERAVAMAYCLIGLLSLLAIVKLLSLFSHWNGFLTLAYVSYIVIVFGGLFYIAHLNRDRE